MPCLPGFCQTARVAGRPRSPLREVDKRLASLTGFHITPVAGLVPTRQFYGSLADRVSLDAVHPASLRSLLHARARHRARDHRPHGTCSPATALPISTRRPADVAPSDDEGLARLFRRCSVQPAIRGAVGGRRTSRLRPGLLSSFGEIEAFRSARSVLHLQAMGTLDYDITRYQPVLFAAESFDRLIDELTTFFDGYDDEEYARLRRSEPSRASRRH